MSAVLGIRLCEDPDHRHAPECRQPCEICEVLYPPDDLVDGICAACWRDHDAMTRALLPPAAACPQCGESDIDRLEWLDDDWVRCSSCGRVYEPAAGLTERTITPERILAAAGIDDARQAEYQRRLSSLLAGR